ncbi:MAG: alanine--tRNA ligase-related protein, partial [Desulfobulbaceae bacterium]
MLVVMVIVGILAIGVVFMFADPTAKVKAAAFEMRGDLNLARAEAVRRNDNILVDFVFTAEADCSKIDKDSLYVTVFEGDKSDKLGFDQEAQNYWLKHIPAERILKGNKKDNFWEM